MREFGTRGLVNRSRHHGRGPRRDCCPWIKMTWRCTSGGLVTPCGEPLVLTGDLSRRRWSILKISRPAQLEPNPQRKVKTIDFVSSMDNPAPFLIAITGEQ